MAARPSSPEHAADSAASRAALRTARLAAREALPVAERETLGRRIEAHLAALLAARPPGVLAFCAPVRGEFDARPLAVRLLAAGWRAAMPVVVAPAAPMVFRAWSPETVMTTDRHGIPVPAEDARVTPDVLLLPLVAFDAAGHRIGYGGGYFDRTLAALVPRPLAIGVGYELGRVESIRPEPHDIPLDAVVTEAGVAPGAGCVGGEYQGSLRSSEPREPRLMLPFLLLQPLPDADHRWSALRVSGALDAEILGRLAGPMGLAEAAAGLELRVPSSVLDGLGGVLPGLALVADDNAAPPPAPLPPPQGGPALAVLLKLLQQLTGDAETHDIETTLKHDPELSVQLLRLVNSVAFAPGKKITSFGQAITLLGRRQLQRWLQLLLYARQGAGGGANPLLVRAAWRAAMMENLCRHAGGGHEAQDEAFMVGMFSLLEALFAKPLAEIVEPLRLAEEITAALLRREGQLGRLLALVEAAERGLDEALPLLGATGIGAEAWCETQIAALRWALQVDRES